MASGACCTRSQNRGKSHGHGHGERGGRGRAAGAGAGGPPLRRGVLRLEAALRVAAPTDDARGGGHRGGGSAGRAPPGLVRGEPGRVRAAVGGREGARGAGGARSEPVAGPAARLPRRPVVRAAPDAPGVGVQADAGRGAGSAAADVRRRRRGRGRRSGREL